MTAMARMHEGRRRLGGFSLVELMLVVVMIGILSAIGGVAWMRYVKRSRTSEAVGHLQKMWVGAMGYYEADHADSTGAMLNKQFPTATAGGCVPVWEMRCCLNTGDGRCPGTDPTYLEEPWKSLGFNIADKHNYRPLFLSCPDPRLGMHAEARGDLDCDGTESIFIRKANVLPNGDVQGYATPAIVNETE